MQEGETFFLHFFGVFDLISCWVSRIDKLVGFFAGDSLSDELTCCNLSIKMKNLKFHNIFPSDESKLRKIDHKTTLPFNGVALCCSKEDNSKKFTSEMLQATKFWTNGFKCDVFHEDCDGLDDFCMVRKIPLIGIVGNDNNITFCQCSQQKIREEDEENFFGTPLPSQNDDIQGDPTKCEEIQAKVFDRIPIIPERKTFIIPKDLLPEFIKMIKQVLKNNFLAKISLGDTQINKKENFDIDYEQLARSLISNNSSEN